VEKKMWKDTHAPIHGHVLGHAPGIVKIKSAHVYPKGEGHTRANVKKKYKYFKNI
jgi:hypothetical protein